MNLSDDIINNINNFFKDGKVSDALLYMSAQNSLSQYQTGKYENLDKIIDSNKDLILTWLENYTLDIQNAVMGYNLLIAAINPPWKELKTWWDDRKKIIIKRLLILMKHQYYDSVFTIINTYLHGKLNLKWPELDTIMKSCRAEIYNRSTIYENNNKQPTIEESMRLQKTSKSDLEYIKKYPWLIREIDNPSLTIQLASVSQDGTNIRYINNPSKKVQLVAVNDIGMAIEYIDNPTEDIQLAAINQEAWAIELIDKPSPKAWELARKPIIREILVYIKNNNTDHAIRLYDSLRNKNCPWPELDIIERSLHADNLIELQDNQISENFADGKKPGRKGLAKRVGVNCKQSVTKLRSIAKNSSGERRRMAHWCANMKSGKQKNNESTKNNIELVQINEVIAPHGSPENELAMMKAGTKPAVLMLDYHFNTLYKPIVDKMGWEVVRFTGPEHTSYVVAQRGDRARAEKIAKLVSDASKHFGTGKKIDPEYHRTLGALLGYSKEDIEHFISNVYGDKKVSEGDVITSKFISKQLQKNKTPYQFNQSIADDIPVYDPKGRYGTYHKSGKLKYGDEEVFDHFEVKEQGKSASIVGVTKNGKRIVVSTTTKMVADALVDAYNRSGFTDKDIKKVEISPTRTDEEKQKVKYDAALTIFDIDETLFHTQAKVLVRKDGKVVKELSNKEFNTYILDSGETFDFSQFTDAKFFHDTSIPIENMWDKAKDILNKVGRRPGSRVIIVTARSDFDDKDTFLNTFRKHGLDIDKMHVHRAGNLNLPSALGKKIIIKKYLESGKFDMVRLFDDAESNLRSFLSLKKDFPNIIFKAYMVYDDGSIKEYKI